MRRASVHTASWNSARSLPGPCLTAGPSQRQVTGEARGERGGGRERGRERGGGGRGERKGGEVKVYTECCCVRFETRKHSPPVVFQALSGMYMYSPAFYIFTCTSSELSADSSSKMASVLRTAWPASSTRGTVNFTWGDPLLCPPPVAPEVARRGISPHRVWYTTTMCRF